MDAVLQTWFATELLGLTIVLSGYSALIIGISVPIYWRYARKIRAGMRPPISSWVLWWVIDLLAFSFASMDHTFSLQLAVYILGTMYIIWTLIAVRSFGVNRFDVVTAIATGVAVACWLYTSDAFVGLTLMLVAMTIASLPYFINDMRGHEDDMVAWVGMFLGSVAAYASGEHYIAVWMMVLQGLFIGVLAYWHVRRICSVLFVPDYW